MQKCSLRVTDCQQKRHDTEDPRLLRRQSPLRKRRIVARQSRERADDLRVPAMDTFQARNKRSGRPDMDILERCVLLWHHLHDYR